MPFEIDMLSVGNADAIILRYLNLAEIEYVVVIDAGKTQEHGRMVVEHVKKYSTQQYIDLAINTHPDHDHVGGFNYVVNNIEIKKFWIHDPVQHKKVNDTIIKSFTDNKAFDISKSLQYVVESLNQSKSLIELIDNKKIEREEPFEGLEHPLIPIKVLGPSEDYYEEKLHGFRDIGLLYESLIALEKAQIDGQDWIDELYRFDKKIDRSNENNSSAIVLFTGDKNKVLFTSDAGPEALNRVIEVNDLSNLNFLDVPHHGSQYNINTEIIDIFNPKRAYISCTDKYPSETLVKYLKEKKCRVFTTKKYGQLRHRSNMPDREGWSSITPL